MKISLTTVTHKKTPVDHTYRFCYRCEGLYDVAEEKILKILTCCDCHRHVHASCAGLNDKSLASSSTYDWQCQDCKTCIVCHCKEDKDNILICVICDRSLHANCCPIERRGNEGDWCCDICLSMITSPPSSKRDIALLSSTDRPENGKDGTEHSTGGNDSQDDHFATFRYYPTKEESYTRGIPSKRDIDLFEKTRIHLKPEQRMDLPDVPLESASFVGPRYTNRTFPKTRWIQFGNSLIDIWFPASSYPVDYNQYPTIYICEYCLTYMKSAYTADRHKTKCPIRRPPGKEIYRNGAISIFEVNGRNHKTYCQNLCLLAKLFLDHKTLFLDVEPFFFYVMTERDNDDYHLVGYFSKENRSPVTHNVCCILTMPNHQRKGYGQYLIDFSYLLSKREGLVGSPEKPLSNLGLISYQSYWKDVIFRLLQYQTDPISLSDISTITSMTIDDIVATLQRHDMISSPHHIYLDSIPIHESLTAPIDSPLPYTYKLHIDFSMIDAHVDEMNQRQSPVVDPAKLVWTPCKRQADYKCDTI